MVRGAYQRLQGDRRSAGDGAVAASFRSGLRRATRETTLMAGVFALAVSPIWLVFDAVLVPEQFGEFFVVRMIMEVGIAVCLAALYWHRLGGRFPQALSLATLLALDVGGCWMVTRSGPQMEAYLLGISLVIFATGFMVIWRWQLTLALLGVIAASIAGFSIAADPGLDAGQITTCAFYLLTVGALTLSAQEYRERKLWQQHVTDIDLEAERQRNEELVRELNQLSRQDPLTSLGNRRAWEQRVAEAWSHAYEDGGGLALVMCDLDNFKGVNDRFGHAAGDAVLADVAAVLATCVRQSDFVARLGGDEFAILCSDTSTDQAGDLAARVSERVRRATLPHGVRITVSIGVAQLNVDDDVVENLYHRADQALYAAKVDRDTIRWADSAMVGAATGAHVSVSFPAQGPDVLGCVASPR